MRATWLIWLAAVLSGGAALSYEICWTRALVVPLGNSTDASALVLAGFMLGIAAGGRAGGGLAERVKSPLRWYATIEALLGVYALLAPGMLSLLSGIPAAGGGAIGLVPRYGAALALVVVPCLAMGATLPLLVRVLTGPGTSLRYQINVAYGANTLGAGSGALATGFWGIAALGVWRCSAWTAAASALAALVALVAARFAPRGGEPVGSVREPAARTPAPAPMRSIALVAAFVSGYAMLSCEVLWSRVLTFVFGHDTYAFASLLAIVLFGLAIGGLGHRLMARWDQTKVMAALLSAFSLSMIASFWAAAHLTMRMGRDPLALDAARELSSSSVWLELARSLVFTPILVLIPSILSGALYPAACSVWGDGAPDAGRKVGIFGFVNGAGAALGAMVSAFGLVAATGIQGAFILVAGLVCLVAAAAIHLSVRTKVLSLSPVVASALIALWMPRGLPQRMLLKVVGDRHQRLLHYEEGRTGTVSVTRNAIQGEKILWMNAVNEVTTRLVHDQSFKILGHLGPLLHPNPKRAVMICLGAGLSAGATARHPIERLDVVDLSSAVPRAARQFAVENNHVLDDPVFRLHEGDGRQFLLNSAGDYDVAVIDSTHPKSVDSWILYTKEFYELVRLRLSAGGIVVQWLPLHGMSEREFKIIVRTFLAAFPEMTLWANAGFETYGHVAYAKLVGIKGAPLTLDVERLSQRLQTPRIHDDLAPFRMGSVEEVLDLFLAEPAKIDAWTEGLPIQTDDHPIVPYATSYSSGRRMVPALLLGVRTSVKPLLRSVPAEQLARISLSWESQGLVLAGMVERAAEIDPQGGKIQRFVEQTRTTLPYYTRFAEIYRGDPERLFEAATQLGALGYPREARPLYEQALALRPGDFRIRLNLALVLVGLADSDRAIGMLSKLKAEHPKSSIVAHNLGAALLAIGDQDAAAGAFKEAIDWDPESTASRVALARILVSRGEPDRAEPLIREVLRRNPWEAEAYALLGACALVRGRQDAAIAELTRAIELQPYQAAWHQQLGVAYAGQGRFEQAADQQVQALELEPGNASAAFNLGVALRGQGRSAEALEAFCLAERLNPAWAQKVSETGSRCER